MEQKTTAARTERRAVEIAALVLALIFGALAPVHHLFLDAPTGPVLTVLAAANCVLLLLTWYRLRRGKLQRMDVVSPLVCLVPAAYGVVHLAVSRNLEQTTLLLLTLVGAAAIVTSVRAMAVLAGAICVGWLVVVLVEQIGSPAQVTHHAVLLVVAIGTACLVFAVRIRGTLALRQARSRVGTQFEDLQRTQVSQEESERRFREVFTASPVGIALADENGHFIEVNEAWCRLLGRRPEELMGRSSRDFTHENDLEQHAGMSQRMDVAAPVGGVIRVEKRWIRPNGEIRWGWLSIAAVHGPDGQRWTLAHAQDVTERKAVEAALQRSQAALGAIARVARCVQSGEDPRPTVLDEVHQLSAAAAVAVLEEDGDGEVPGEGEQSVAAAHTLVVTGSIGCSSADLQVQLDGGSAAATAWRTGEHVLVVADPDVAGLTPAGLATAALWQPVLEQDQVIALLVVIWDRPISGPDDPAVHSVQALAGETASAFTAARLRDELQSLVDTDPLTGIANRRGWNGRIRELSALSRRTGQPLTLAVIDLDHFKIYNDTFGHHDGDVLLRSFATRANSMLRSGDLLARWGGEEFAVALPGCAAADATQILDRLRQAVPGDQTCSIGHATLRVGESPAECLMRADTTLYEAKRRGRNRVLGAT